MLDVRGQSDGFLVRRVLEGDTAAYAGLVNRYRDRLARYATRMLGNAADAEEALQDAFVRGYRYLARCSDPERFGAWLFGILVNRCRTLGSQRARRQRHIVHDESAMARASVSHSEGGADLMEAIEHAVAQLQPAQREAFLLKYVEEMSYEEMTRLTGTRISALKMRVSRARQELRRLLEGVDGV
ncbi:MAG: RNA polymerase sigma factor [Gemmatimonadota bacterium]|nr:MAG: RNA polymerase sigma factor [Gemmatimonadota bacterium]